MLSARAISSLCRHIKGLELRSISNMINPKTADTGFLSLPLVRYYGRPKQTINFDFSGDLIPKPKIDGKELFFPFKDVDGVQDADEVVKKLCSLEYCDGKQRTFHKEYEMMRTVEELLGPDAYLEKKIVRFTLHIRNMVPYCLSRPRDKRMKSLLVERIAKRKRYLKELRIKDYETFIWLLKELKIRYIPAKKTLYISKHQKKINENQVIADEMRKKKEEEIELALESEKEEYLKYKQEVLAEIDREIEEHGLNKEEILENVEQIRYKRESPPDRVRTKFASLKDWTLPKMPPVYHKLK